MADYPELYKLELTGGQFEARYITTPPEDLPAECILPGVLHSIPALPPIEVTLPPMECKFDIEEPLIPIPFACNPGFDANISISVCPDAQEDLSVGGGFTFQRKTGTECDYELKGSLDFCMTCIPEVIAEVAIGTCEVNGQNSLSVIQDIPIDVVYNEETCEYKLVGDLKFCVPCIPTFDANFNITTEGDTPAVEFGNGGTGGVVFTYDDQACEWTLESDIFIKCIPRYNANFRVTINDSNGGLVSGGRAGSVEADPDNCNQSINDELTLDIGCVVQNVIGSSMLIGNSHGEPAFITVEAIPTGAGNGCPGTILLGGTGSMSACSSVEVEWAEQDVDVEIPITWGDDGDEIGKIELTLALGVGAATGEHPDCGAKLSLNWTQTKANIKLPTKSISLCSSGSTTNYNVLVDPESEESSG